MLIKEHRFTFLGAADVYLFRVEELIEGLAFWPSRFRLKLPASTHWEARTIYGSSCNEVAQKAANSLSGDDTSPASSESRAWLLATAMSRKSSQN
jgi:hypothetical protein